MLDDRFQRWVDASSTAGAVEPFMIPLVQDLVASIAISLRRSAFAGWPRARAWRLHGPLMTLRLLGLKEGKKIPRECFSYPTPDSDLGFWAMLQKIPPACQAKSPNPELPIQAQ